LLTAPSIQPGLECCHGGDILFLLGNLCQCLFCTCTTQLSLKQKLKSSVVKSEQHPLTNAAGQLDFFNTVFLLLRAEGFVRFHSESVFQFPALKKALLLQTGILALQGE